MRAEYSVAPHWGHRQASQRSEAMDNLCGKSPRTLAVLIIAGNIPDAQIAVDE